MFEQSFKNIDDTLRKDAGCSNELDYIEQTSWVLFLKYLDDFENERRDSAELRGVVYTPIIADEFKWSAWAMPKGDDGKLDHQVALTGDDLTDFVNQKLFPYLKNFKTTTENSDTIEYKIGVIYSELRNRLQSGYNLREVIEHIDQLKFSTSAEKHEMSHLYESKIKNMGNAGRNGGEYYTPRPLIRTIIKVVNPKIGETIYDGAVGSAGFLVEAYEYLNNENLSTDEYQTLQKKTFYGKEKKSLAYIIGIMNMILHGIEAPNILHTNTLTENISNIEEKDRFDVILANPPFGSSERGEIQQNFPIKTSETAYLFLQHFIKHLRAGGKAGLIIKNTFLTNLDNGAIDVRKYLLGTCNLHTILILPKGTFVVGAKTIVLFFEKGQKTKKIWLYKLKLEKNLGKTNPLREEDLQEFMKYKKENVESDNSWIMDISSIDENTFEISPKNPNLKNEKTFRSVEVLISEIGLLENKSKEIVSRIEELT